MALTDFAPKTGRLNIQIDLDSDPEPMFCTCGVHGNDTLTMQEDADDLVQILGTAICAGMTGDAHISRGTFAFNGTVGIGPATQLFEVALAPVLDGIYEGEEACPPNVAGLIRKRTGVAGRGANGRLFIPVVPEAEVSKNGGMSTLWKDNMNTAFSTLNALFNAVSNGYSAVVNHHGPAPDHDVEAPTYITSWQADPIAATQRRRLR